MEVDFSLYFLNYLSIFSKNHLPSDLVGIYHQNQHLNQNYHSCNLCLVMVQFQQHNIYTFVRWWKRNLTGFYNLILMSVNLTFPKLNQMCVFLQGRFVYLMNWITTNWNRWYSLFNLFYDMIIYLIIKMIVEKI